MIDTINSIVEEDNIEIFKLAEKESEEESEKENCEEFEFIHNQFPKTTSKNESISAEYNPYINTNSYNSPIQLVFTPPPNFVILS